MSTIENIEFGFYQNLGKLFYAIAASDKVVQKIEYDALRDIVKSQWLDMDDYEDEFHTDAAYQIEIVFDWLDYQQLDADSCFKDFEMFKKENEPLFSLKRKQLIWKTANTIANAFRGKNKSELIMLTKLKILLAN